MSEQLTHVWCQLSADSTPSTPVNVVDHGPRLDALASVVQELARKLDNLDGHSHSDLEGKIGTVQNALGETVASSLREARCSQAKAHDELKAAFGELASRLDTLKTDHKDVSKDVVIHDDRLEHVDGALNHLASAFTDLETRVANIPTPTIQLVDETKPMPIWPLVLLVILWIADMALRFVPIK